MKLREIFDALTSGELSQLHIGDPDTGVIGNKRYDQLISHTNLGLTALHRRFCLKEGQIVLDLMPGVYSYRLHSEHAISTEAIAFGTQALEIDGGIALLDVNSPSDDQYVHDDLVNPFQDNILKVERVTADSGYELGLNDLSDPYAVRTPRFNLLSVPKSIVDGSTSLPSKLKTTTLTVAFRANHPILLPGAGTYDASQVEVDLPYSHLEALLYFIASRIHNPIGMTNEFHAGNSYAAKYELACQQLEIANLAIDQGSTSDRLSRNGWV